MHEINKPDIYRQQSKTFVSIEEEYNQLILSVYETNKPDIYKEKSTRS